MQMSQTRRERAMALGRSFFAAASITACRPDGEPKVPESIGVMEHLRTLPMGISEEINDDTSKHPLKGRIADCRGKPSCAVPVYTGEIFLNLKIMPEYGGNMEITVSGMSWEALTFKRTIDFNGRDRQVSYQSIAFDTPGRLFNTDLSVTPQKQPNGSILLVIGY